VLAHRDFDKRFRVGKYGVDIEALDHLSVAALHGAMSQSRLVIVDEIGKMEMLSPLFREAASAVIHSGKPVLGTVMLAPNPFTDTVKRQPQVKLVAVTRSNCQTVLDPSGNDADTDVLYLYRGGFRL